jgi:hypothetical protein
MFISAHAIVDLLCFEALANWQDGADMGSFLARKPSQLALTSTPVVAVLSSCQSTLKRALIRTS